MGLGGYKYRLSYLLSSTSSFSMMNIRLIITLSSLQLPENYLTLRDQLEMSQGKDSVILGQCFTLEFAHPLLSLTSAHTRESSTLPLP